MKTPTLFTSSGSKATTKVKLDAAIFDQKPTKHELLHQAYVSYLAAGRLATAVTKRRGEVRGGGRKPWRQKGTGRARVGSIRSPLWRGGGITFGPLGQENYKKKLHKKAKHTALKQALSLSLDEGRLHVIEAVKLKAPKTSAFVDLTKKMDLTGNVLLVTEAALADVRLAVRNIPTVTYVARRHLNVFDVMNADTVLIEKEALSQLSEWLGEKS